MYEVKRNGSFISWCGMSSCSLNIAFIHACICWEGFPKRDFIWHFSIKWRVCVMDDDLQARLVSEVGIIVSIEAFSIVGQRKFLYWWGVVVDCRYSVLGYSNLTAKHFQTIHFLSVNKCNWIDNRMLGHSTFTWVTIAWQRRYCITTCGVDVSQIWVRVQFCKKNALRATCSSQFSVCSISAHLP